MILYRNNIGTNHLVETKNKGDSLFKRLGVLVNEGASKKEEEKTLSR